MRREFSAATKSLDMQRGGAIFLTMAYPPRYILTGATTGKPWVLHGLVRRPGIGTGLA